MANRVRSQAMSCECRPGDYSLKMGAGTSECEDFRSVHLAYDHELELQWKVAKAKGVLDNTQLDQSRN